MLAGNEVLVDVVANSIFKGECDVIVSRVPNFIHLRAGVVLVLIPYGVGHLDVFDRWFSVHGAKERLRQIVPTTRLTRTHVE